MKFQTFFTSISAGFDSLVSKIENHQAVADVTIKEVGAAAAQVQGQRRVQQKRKAKQEEQIQVLTRNCELWRMRALQNREQDREKALICLQSLKRDEAQLVRVKEIHEQTGTLIANLDQRLRDIESKLLDLQNQRATLSARSVSNKVNGIADCASDLNGVDQVFERWEMSVSSDEYVSQAFVPSHDTLDQEFRREENREALLAELDGLRADGLGVGDDDVKREHKEM